MFHYIGYIANRQSLTISATMCLERLVAMKKIYKVATEHGYYLFKLEELLEQRKVSKNQLMRDTNTDFKVLQRLMKGNVVRIDIEVLARLCDYFDCGMTELIEYFPNRK